MPDTPPSGDERDPFLDKVLSQESSRNTLLALEAQLRSFVEDTMQYRLTLRPMNGYYRMLAHRLGHRFLLDHAVERGKLQTALLVPSSPANPHADPIFTSLPPTPSVVRRSEGAQVHHTLQDIRFVSAICVLRGAC